jgi:hypothetical protein
MVSCGACDAGVVDAPGPPDAGVPDAPPDARPDATPDAPLPPDAAIPDAPLPPDAQVFDAPLPPDAPVDAPPDAPTCVCDPDQICVGGVCKCGLAQICKGERLECGPATSSDPDCKGETVECGACPESNQYCAEGTCKPFEGDDACKYCEGQGFKSCCCLATQSPYCTFNDVCPGDYQTCATCEKEPEPCKSRPSECGPGIDACELPFDCGPCAEQQMCIWRDEKKNACKDGVTCDECCKGGGFCCTLPDGTQPYCLLDPRARGCPAPYEARCLPN